MNNFLVLKIEKIYFYLVVISKEMSNIVQNSEQQIQAQIHAECAAIVTQGKRKGESCGRKLKDGKCQYHPNAQPVLVVQPIEPVQQGQQQPEEIGVKDKHAEYFNGKPKINPDTKLAYIDKPKYIVDYVPPSDFSIEIVSRPSILDGITLKELVDENLLDKVLMSNICNSLTVHYTSKQQWSNLKAQLVAYKKELKRHIKETIYTIPKEHKMGRTVPEKSLSMGVITRPIRHIMLSKDWVDIDQENSQPTIFSQLCKKLKISCPLLEGYALHRNEYFSIVGEYFYHENGEKLNTKKEDGSFKYKDVLKPMFIIMLFYGSFKCWLDNYPVRKFYYDGQGKKVNTTVNDCPQLKDMYTELKMIGNTIMFHNKAYFNLVLQESKKKTKMVDGVELTYENEMGTAMSIFLQEYERRILDQMYIFLRDNQVIRDDLAILCFDGLMVRKEHWNDSYLIKMSRYIKEKTGFNIKFTVKTMNEGDHLLSQIKEYNPTEEHLSKFDKMFFDKIVTYGEKKQYFERFFTKVRNPCGILETYYNKYAEKLRNEKLRNEKSDEEREVQQYQYSVKDFSTSYCDLKFITLSVNQQMEIVQKEEQFVPKWLDDFEIKVSQTLNFYPMNKTESEMLEGTIEDQKRGEVKANIFTGYSDIVKTPYDKEYKLLREMPFYEGNIDGNVGKWLKLMTSLCGGNFKHAMYLVKCYAMKIQHPTRKIPVGIVITGRQGTGKNLHQVPIAKIIGDRHYITSDKVSDFYGDHAEGFVNKLIVNMNEVEGKDTMDFQGRLKSTVTEESITVNMKFIRPFKVKNYALLTIFSNKPNPIQIDVRSGDRRWCVFKADSTFLDKKKYGSIFWLRLAELFNSAEFIAELYDYLNNPELIEKFDPIRERPITKAYYEMASLSIPREAMFLEHMYTRALELCPYDEDSLLQAKKRREWIENECQIGWKPSDVWIPMKGTDMYQSYVEWSISNGLMTEQTKPNIKLMYSGFESLECSIVRAKDGHTKLDVLSGNLHTIMKELSDKKMSRVFEQKSKDDLKEEILEDDEEGTEVDNFFNDM